MQNRIMPANKEEEIFVARICDLFYAADQKNITKTSMFLDQRQQALCSNAAYKVSSVDHAFFGGYAEAQRKMLCVFSSYEDEDSYQPPFQGITFLYRKQDMLTHRDFLGAIMGLQIKRESVGDILVEEGRTIAFVHNAVAPLIHQEMQLVGRVGVRVLAGYEDPLPLAQKFLEITGTVASLRLDCVLALLLQESREKASECILSGAVSVNAVPVQNRAATVVPGDVIVMRGFGKAILDNVGERSRKNRMHIVCKKFL